MPGERTGYAYSDDLSPEKIRKAARVAAYIAKGPASIVKTGFEEAHRHNLYPMLHAPHEIGLAERVELVKRADLAARAYDARVFQVQATYADSLRNVLVATSEGRLSFDRQPMARMSVSALARQGDGPPQHGHSGGGGRVTLDFFLKRKRRRSISRAKLRGRRSSNWTPSMRRPAKRRWCSAPGWPGILLHEAVGHGLEADFNRKGVSAFSGRIGQQVASPLCTVIDDGTIGSRRGSLNVDDEGMPTQKNVLIENGILRGYLQDKLSSRLTNNSSTGSGRRESYQHIPMPRMTNTYMLAGESDPEEIITLGAKRPVLRDVRRRPGGHHQRQFRFLRDGKLSDRKRQVNAAGARRVADRQRAGSAEVREHGGQRSAARRRHRRVRQRRAERAGGRRHSDRENRPHDRGRHIAHETIL